MENHKIHHPLRKKFPPSESCSCNICKGFCIRPGWWIVSEAQLAIQNGFAHRMMLEISPDSAFGVLSPAFKGNEGLIAMQVFSKNYCTFYSEGLCELFGREYQPLECRFVHHRRKGQGMVCHAAIEKDWNTMAGKKLVKTWIEITGFVGKISKLYPNEIIQKIKFL